MFDRVAGHYDTLNGVMTAGPAPPLARAGGGSDGPRAGRVGTRRLLRDRRPRLRAGPASRPRRPRGRLRLLRADARPGAGQGRGARRRGGPLRVGRRARAALRRRALRRGDGRLRRPQPGRPRPRPARDGAGAEAGRTAGHPRDHPADAAAAVDLLLALVRPPRAAARLPLRRARGLQLPAGVGAQLPLAPRPGREDGPGRLHRDPLHGAGRRHHRDPQRRQGPASGRSAADGPRVGRATAGDGGPRRLPALAPGAARRSRGPTP